MAERYTRVYTLDSNQYQIDSPVIIAAGALLKDNKNDTVLAQVKYKSVADNDITALKVAVQPMDVRGEKLGGEVEYQYLDLSAKRDDEFGQKVPIRLPDNNTRQFSIKILDALFDDNTDWKADSFEVQMVPESESLSDALHNDSDLIEQFKLEYGEKSILIPVIQDAYWKCSCGAFNRANEEYCHACNNEKAVLIKIDLDGLAERKDCRLKNQKYNEAVNLALDDTIDSLTKAKEILYNLGDWNDVKDKCKEYESRIKDIKYEEAISLSKQDTIDSLTKAKEVLTDLDNWKDSENRLKEFEARIKDIKYEEAVSLSKQNTLDSLTEAKNIMTDLSGWKKADEEAKNYGDRIEDLKDKYKTEKAAKKKKAIMATSIVCVIIAIILVYNQIIMPKIIIPNQKYNEAVELMNNSEYEEAVAAFKDMNGYRDSDDKILECYYLQAVDYMDNQQYVEALTLFYSSNGYKDSDDKIKECIKKANSKLEVGSTYFFGNYEQDGNEDRGKEPIAWQVLTKEDNKILIISKYGLDGQKYSDVRADVTWETSTLRDWLNSTFMDMAFSKDEKSQIQVTTVTADKNPKYDSNPGNDTQDQVFLLSIQEVEKYFSSDGDRKTEPTAYALETGVYEMDSCSRWWLRSPGNSSNFAASVNSAGFVDYYGNYIFTGSNAVRPAMWISIE